MWAEILDDSGVDDSIDENFMGMVDLTWSVPLRKHPIFTEI
jgi:hypothetical protein